MKHESNTEAPISIQTNHTDVKVILVSNITRESVCLVREPSQRVDSTLAKQMRKWFKDHEDQWR